MGTYKTVYIGIYMEVENGKTIVDESYFADPDTGQETKTAFNPHTGKENAILNRKKEETIYSLPHNIEFEGMDEEFFAADYSGAPINHHTWIPNKRGPFNLTHKEDVFNFEIDSIDIPALKDAFLKKYATYLEEVGKHFNYRVKFGIVYYAH